MTAHALAYGVWLTGQIIKESWVMAVDTFGAGRHIAPIVLYYPLRVTTEREIAAFTASITMTPGTLALGLTGPKEVDDDATRGERSRRNAAAAGSSEFDTHGLDHVQRFLAVHCMYGSEPQEILDGLADMEEHLAPWIKAIPLNVNVEHIVERGRPGPRGWRGSRGGRNSDETVFDVEKLDSTPHAAAFVAAILRQEEDEKDVDQLESMDYEERYEVARRNAERARARREKTSAARTEAVRAAGAPDIDTFGGDNLGGSFPDRIGRTKPGETLYDPLYPKNTPKAGDVTGTAVRRKYLEDQAKQRGQKGSKKNGAQDGKGYGKGEVK